MLLQRNDVVIIVSAVHVFQRPVPRTFPGCASPFRIDRKTPCLESAFALFFTDMATARFASLPVSGHMKETVNLVSTFHATRANTWILWCNFQATNMLIALRAPQLNPNFEDKIKWYESESLRLKRSKGTFPEENAFSIWFHLSCRSETHPHQTAQHKPEPQLEQRPLRKAPPDRSV